MIGYHATNNLSLINQYGIVRPKRLLNVYLFTTKKAAENYKNEFDYEGIVKVFYKKNEIERKWKPKYAKGGEVIKLKRGVWIISLPQK